MKIFEGVAEFIETIPEWDEQAMLPKTKMPDCPKCGEDELAMLSKGIIWCYRCAFKICIDGGTKGA